MAFWRKNEKDELLAKKKAEKEALERAKAEEEARESKRQSRKLNFLLTQTELYSHFIGKEAEGDETPDVDPHGANGDLGLDENGEPLPDLDYDDGASGDVHGVDDEGGADGRRRGESPATCCSRCPGRYQSREGQGKRFRPRCSSYRGGPGQ